MEPTDEQVREFCACPCVSIGHRINCPACGNTFIDRQKRIKLERMISEATACLESQLLLERLAHSRTKAELQEVRDEAQNAAWESAEARDMAQDD